MVSRTIEDVLNRWADMDWGWWPFLWLRPGRDVPLTTGRVALMSVLYGPLFGGLIALSTLFGRQPELNGQVAERFIWIVGGVIVLFFVVYRLTFAVAWNARARRLRAGHAKTDKE